MSCDLARHLLLIPLQDAAAALGLAEQDAVEPQVSKGRWWGGQAQPVGPQHTSCRLVVSD